MCAPKRYDHDQDARNAPRATRWCTLRSVHHLDSVPVSLPTTHCETTDASAILAQASVGLNAVALVWILPNLSFATAVPPFTLHGCTTRVMTTLSVGGPAGGMETPAGRGVYPGSPSSPLVMSVRPMRGGLVPGIRRVTSMPSGGGS
jgi:hypothetical protein